MRKTICRISQYYYIIHANFRNMNQHCILSWIHVYGINVPSMNRTKASHLWMVVVWGVKEKGWEKVS